MPGAGRPRRSSCRESSTSRSTQPTPIAREDLKAIEVPTLVLHGDDDQVVPYADASLLQVKLLQKGTLKIYPGYPHGMLTTHADVINPDILAFIKG